MVMIETLEAIQNIDAICAVDGLDAIVIGANDLAGSMGIPCVRGFRFARSLLGIAISPRPRRICFIHYTVLTETPSFSQNRRPEAKSIFQQIGAKQRAM